MDLDRETTAVFVVGTIIASFIFTSTLHFTIGQRTCEQVKAFKDASESLSEDNMVAKGLPSREEACSSILEKWFKVLTFNLSILPIWVFSLMAGFLTAGFYSWSTKE